ncbi:inactive peptidyl-prolyl cis-trans isomerase shutdown [Drosophila ficusphila]|uniref:inactive peptidyl-prolyl cis-trans isomerase shutdown n=1 Tax=Drosophila ficusphila TaxID=30025 RepID=UPI0007E807A0|nr:inactive peptidyl-prolyl cis-trans isomerase shutdown [Drosophila ficusphila]
MWDISQQKYIGGDEDYENVPSPWMGSFDKLRGEMNRIDAHIYKRVVREGHEERDPVPDKARVSIRYRGYWEGEKDAFEASELCKFETGKDMVLQGLEAAVRTMRPYEQADFIISNKVLKCLSRNPKRNALFQVEVIDYFPIVKDELPEEELDKFYVVYPKAKDFYQEAKIWVKRLRYPNAVSTFQKGINSLKSCRITNSEEEQQQTELLINISQGLMICYNNMNKPKCACVVMKDIRRLTRNNPSWRALFQEGRALVSLGDHHRARKSLILAQKKQPENQFIKDEIVSINQRIRNLEEARQEIIERTEDRKMKLWIP